MNLDFDELIKISLETDLETASPNFRKKNRINKEDLTKIVQTVSYSLGITNQAKTLIGIMLLFLQGAASSGAPITMSIDLGEGLYIEKRNLMNACLTVTGHQYIRRIAETLAKEIGDFAFKNKLAGELAYRINNRFKATEGKNLSDLEMAYCSSFSQAIPNLAEITSERLAQLLAADYQMRFEKRKKSPNDKSNTNINNTKRRNKGKGRRK